MNIVAQNESRGRKATSRNVQLRKAVIKTLVTHNTILSTKDVAKITKQSKVRVTTALRWAMNNGYVEQVGSRVYGRGRPVATWKAS
jgi:predicted transcriptional regulator